MLVHALHWVLTPELLPPVLRLLMVTAITGRWQVVTPTTGQGTGVRKTWPSHSSQPSLCVRPWQPVNQLLAARQCLDTARHRIQGDILQAIEGGATAEQAVSV